ncbi:hypothetical protein VKT23_001833 [Stygiomarasmius scandens]|uniref:Uncharacterized protein n=1 Tax=Marasmiellus scandens TaxID=2682957 RepID=A0ABR1K1J8_9AGAR
MSSTPSIPDGYTFLNKQVFLSAKAKEMTMDLLKQADQRNPDLFDMYIYNDFYSYATLDLFHKTLSSLHGKVCKRKYDEAWPIAEALTHFVNLENAFVMCYDGELIKMTNKAYGCLIVGLIRGLKKDNRLDPSRFPSLECFLKNVTEFCGLMKSQGCNSDYDRVCKAVGHRLFKNKTDEQRAQEIAWAQAWWDNLKKDGDNDDSMEGEDEDEDEDDEDNDGRSWFHGADEADEDMKDPDFSRERVWKEYKDYLRGVPDCPMRGPPYWDISEWEEQDKKPFLFSSME